MNSKAVSFSFLEGGGEMGALTRSFDWEQTSLGSPAGWDPGLRTIVGMLLQSHFPMFLFWGPALICFYNDAYRPSLGNNGKHPALGKKGAEVWPEIWPEIYPQIAQVLAGEGATWHEDQLLPIYRNGHMEDVYWTYSYSPVRNEKGAIEGCFVTCVETTRRIAKTARIEASEQAIRHLFVEAPVGITIYKGPDYTIESINKKALQILGKQEAEVLGRPLLKALPELMQQDLPAILENIYQKGIPFYANGLEVALTVEDQQKLFYFNLSLEPVVEADGHISGIIGVGTDVTDLVTAQQQREESEKNFKSLVLQAPVAMCVLRGAQFVVEVANGPMLAIWGKRETDVLHRPIVEGLPEVRHQGLEGLLETVFQTGERVTAHERPISFQPQGKADRRFIDFVYEPIRETDGSINGVMVLAMDVTVQVAARHQIEEAEERSRLSVEAADLGTYDVNLQTGETVISERCAAIFGFDRVVNREDLVNMIHPEDHAVRDEAYRQAMAGGKMLYEARTVWKDGSLHWFRVAGQIRFNDEHQPVRLVGIVLDITDQKEFTQQLERQVAERTAELAQTNALLQQSNSELEQFAYIASHDLQEPLRKVRTFSELLERSLGMVSPEARTYMDKITAASGRMLTLIRDVLHFSQLSTAGQAFIPVNLNEVLENVVTDFELLIEQKGALIRLDNLPVIAGIPLQLYQLFYNLVGNALKFTAGDRQPEIQIRCRKATEVEAATLAPDVNYFHMEVSDNGIGFEPEYAEQIFTIFQRLHNRSDYAGTGIGLALCRKIVLNHGGSIEASGVPGAGARFTMLLPQQQH